MTPHRLRPRGGRLLDVNDPRKPRGKRLILAWIMALFLAAPSIAVSSEEASAADGTILRTITAANYNCSIGTGIAFDGTNLLLSCDYDNKIIAVSPADGSFVREYTISGLSAIGALAWDRGRNRLWACGGFGGDDTIVYQINLDDQTSTQAFGGTQGCPDGLAYDGTDDTLYLSADVSSTVQHYKVDGTLIANIDVSGKLGGCGNSGIAVGGQYLFLANNGCSQIYRSLKASPSDASLFGTYPARIEDMECDDLSFRSANKAAIWTKDAYDGVLNAFELNAGDCGFGGQPPGNTDADTDGDGLPDSWETNGVDVPVNGSTVHLDLKAMGADPEHKDLFIETDWMVKPETCIWFICWGGRSFAPQADALEDVAAAYAAAPVSNPDGTTGIRAHIDSGADAVMNPATGEKWGDKSQASAVDYVQTLGTVSDNFYNWSAFNSIRDANFDIARRNVFHYTLFANTYALAPGSSGISRGIPASDTIITDGDPSWGDGFTRIQERGTVMHELGHNLNLRHGGPDNTTYQNDPTYQSIMNYSYQLIGLPPDSRLDYSRTAPYVDWDHILFTGGSVGSFGAALPELTPGTDDDMDPATQKANGTFADPGDGTVRFLGPTMMLGGGGKQYLVANVTNAGPTEATFNVTADAPFLPADAYASVQVAAGATARVQIAVDSTKLTPGTYPVTLHLSSDLLGGGLSSDTGVVRVPDLTDPAQLKATSDALRQLRGLGDGAGIDPALRSSLIQALEAALPWTAKVTTHGQGAFSDTYQVAMPEFAPDRQHPRTIHITGWSGANEFQLSVKAVKPNSTAYKGTIALPQPDGQVLTGTVTLNWDPGTNLLSGSWKGADGRGGLVITLTGP